MECDIHIYTYIYMSPYFLAFTLFFEMSLKRKTPPEKTSRLSTTSSTTSNPIDVRSEDDIEMKQELSFHQIMRNEIIAERKRSSDLRYLYNAEIETCNGVHAKYEELKKKYENLKARHERLKEEAEEEGEWHTKYQKLAVETRKLTVQLEKKKLWELPMKIVVEKIEGDVANLYQLREPPSQATHTPNPTND